ncbi:MAG: N-acetylmuramoyl-L-alanine amidase [Candidatus Krumholzibacteriota bacterium]|nr:N-acetylmuramoyl-L-alanine amidase [Candidatus Krumholzibacteriota bacterium]
MNRSAFFRLYILVLIPLIIGCGTRDTLYDALYSSLEEETDEFDHSVLSGRRIVIDPGHGGAFDGAVGADSLREADANLGVALYLWGMLREAGAQVSLTRTTDHDFLPPGSEELADDLAARMKIANAWEAEVFLSIHHNSHIDRDRERNRIEVYYRGDDPGASLELAEEIHLHLARNLGIPETTVSDGNYFVLRNSSAGASVLGEASYISHPQVEKKLQISTRQKLEAEAYFLGLISYFKRGVPRIERLEPPSDTLYAPASLSFDLRRGADIPLDPTSARIRIGEREIVPLYDPAGGRIHCAMPGDLPNGKYTVSATIKSVRGASASCKPFSLLLNRPAEFILPLQVRGNSRGDFDLSLKVLDRWGYPLADSTKVTVVSEKTGARHAGFSVAGIFHFPGSSQPDDNTFVVTSHGKTETLRFHLPGKGEGDYFILSVVDSVTGKLVPGPQILLPTGESATGDREGSIILSPLPPEGEIIILAAGYVPRRVSLDEISKGASPLKLRPVLDGILRGKRIAIDPGGGGTDDGGRGSGKIRGATVNLKIAETLREILVAAGAEVFLSRSGEETLSLAERVYRTNRFQAHLAIGLHYGSPLSAEEDACLLLHYPGSQRGMAAAEHLSRALGGLPPCKELSLREGAGLFLQQTNCPACEIHAILDDRTEKIYLSPRWIYLEAERILSGIVHNFNERETELFDYTINIIRENKLLRPVSVCLDQALTLIADDEDCVKFSCVTAGEHSVSIGLPGIVPAYTVDIVISAEGPRVTSIEVNEP